MSPIPSWPTPFLERIVCDTRSALRFDDAGLRGIVAARTGERTGIAEAEEHALELLSRQWSRLGPPLAWALVQVGKDYAEHPDRVTQVRNELHAKGADAWIARAVRAQLAFDIGFDVVAENEGVLDL